MIKSQGKVQILLSTYNGETYLEQQLNSLVLQDYPNLNILVRDDGSTDNTLDILREYEKKHLNIKVIRGENLGFVQSFFQLLKMVEPDTDYISFCDQDDVWLSDKVSQAVNILSQESDLIPNLYSCRLTIVDENLNFLSYSPIPSRKLSFNNALVECFLKGCSMFFNKRVLEFLKEYPNHAFGHDWWIYLICSAFGNVIYDSNSKILYRQHHSNLFGLSSTFFNNLNRKVSRTLALRKKQPVLSQAQEFMSLYKTDLEIEKKQNLQYLLNTADLNISPLSRFYFTLITNMYRQNFFDNLVFKIAIFLRFF